MSARQRRQLDRVVDAVARLIPELEPRVIDPTPEKQKQLGLAENALLARVGTYRSVTLSPTEEGLWSIKEFDSRSGDLVEVYEEKGEVPDHLIGLLVLAAAIGSIEEQLTWTGDEAVHEEIRPVLQNLSTLLQQRHSVASGATEAAVEADSDDVAEVVAEAVAASEAAPAPVAEPVAAPVAAAPAANDSPHQPERIASPLQFF